MHTLRKGRPPGSRCPTPSAQRPPGGQLWQRLAPAPPLALPQPHSCQAFSQNITPLSSTRTRVCGRTIQTFPHRDGAEGTGKCVFFSPRRWLIRVYETPTWARAKPDYSPRRPDFNPTPPQSGTRGGCTGVSQPGHGTSPVCPNHTTAVPQSPVYCPTHRDPVCLVNVPQKDLFTCLQPKQGSVGLVLSQSTLFTKALEGETETGVRLRTRQGTYTGRSGRDPQCGQIDLRAAELRADTVRGLEEVHCLSRPNTCF